MVRIPCRIGALMLALLWSVTTILPVSAQSQEEASRSFAQLGQGSMTASTMYGSVSYYFPLPAGRVPVSGTQLELITSHSPLLEPSRSTMTVVVNGQSVASAQLTRANQDRSRLVVPLPVANETDEGLTTFDAAGYFVQVRFLLRLTTNECEETNNPAQWATVHEDSTLRLITAPASNPPGMEALDRYFVPQERLVMLPRLVLPTALTQAELQAAGLAAFQIGRWAAAAGLEPSLAISRTDDLAGDVDTAAVVIAEGDKLPADSTWGDLTWDGSAFGRAEATAEGEVGVLAFDPAVSRLLVSGVSAAGTVDAAQALVMPARRALLTGTHAIVTGAVMTSSVLPAWTTGAASFAQLGMTESRQVSGPGEHIIDFYFRRPPGWDLRADSVLDLALAVPPAVSSDTSWVAVSINGYEVGSRALAAADGAAAQIYSFALPDELLTAGIDGTPVRDLNVRLRLLLNLPQRDCEFIDPTSAWASVLPTSAWRLRYSTDAGLDLGRFPWPLLGDPSQPEQWPSALVLPDEPSDEDVDAALQLMASLGRWHANMEGPLPVLVTAADVNDTLREQYALVLLGDADHNSMTASLVEANANVGRNGPPPAYQLGEAVGPLYLHLVESPWQADRSVLALLGDNSATLRFGAEALGTARVVNQLRGQVAVLTSGMAPQILKDDRPRDLPEALVPQVTLPLIERIPAWQIVAAVLLGIVLAVVLIFLFGLLRRRRAVG